LGLTFAVCLLTSGCIVNFGQSGSPDGSAGAGGAAGESGSGGGGAGTGGTGGVGATGGSGGDAGSAGIGGALVDAGVDAALPVDASLPDSNVDADPRLRLSDMGLYSDFASKTIAPDCLEFDPTYHLWSDGADKTRWIKLPAGTQIDTSDMNHWVFPPGTKVFKEFRLNGQRMETRLIWIGVMLGSFVWAPDGSDAYFEVDGVENVNGTDHDAPASSKCPECHYGEPGRILGFSAMQLSRTGTGLTLSAASQMGLLSNPPPSGTLYPAPGTGVAQQAIGYFHANCGHCHNPQGSAWTAGVHMVLRTYINETSAQSTMLYATTINQPLEEFSYPGLQYRIVPQNIMQSEIVFRMSQRGSDEVPNRNQMPPLATEHVDDTGLMTIESWVNSLPP
jgi:hypothetical protein